jgi:hypothetical protein
VYEWICRGETIYVGRGVGTRYEKFYKSRKYGGEERHKFVRDNKDELTCRFAVLDIALDASKEAEALLINHWGLRKYDGGLFNDQIPNLPILSDLGEDRRRLARFNIPADTPSSDKCLADVEFYDTWRGAKQEFNGEELVEFTGAPTCWQPFFRGKIVKGRRFDDEVLHRCLPATVNEIVEFAKEFGFAPNEIRAKRGHLSWGRDKGYLKIA